ncbi:MAG: diguanylate cyclase [Candidatus Hydrogenedentes bacterium]|nr:diguanylate cyclase [Candidatus Hydrogenedentota bacterium]
MNEQNLWRRRIITIDDNKDIHADFRSILIPRSTSGALDNLESELFGGDDPKPSPRSLVHHFELECALQGEEGAAKIAQASEEDTPFALAFIDMRMPPGWDGVETARRIWEIDPKIQIVICTAYSDYSAEEFNGHFRSTDSLIILKKPFDPIEILQLANALTEKWILAKQANMKMSELRELVKTRTVELEQANRQLLEEVDLRRKAEERLELLSRLDGLTGVPNRRVFDEFLRQEWELATCLGHPLAVVMLDLDSFKAYNDHYGHVAGDACLCQVATALAQFPKRPRNLFARYGGEEFIMIFPQTDTQGALAVARRVVAAIEALAIPHACSLPAGVVTICAGVASLVPTAEDSISSLIVQADTALYAAKKAGKNCACAQEQSPPPGQTSSGKP